MVRPEIMWITILTLQKYFKYLAEASCIKPSTPQATHKAQLCAAIISVEIVKLYADPVIFNISDILGVEKF